MRLRTSVLLALFATLTIMGCDDGSKNDPTDGAMSDGTTDMTGGPDGSMDMTTNTPDGSPDGTNQPDATVDMTGDMVAPQVTVCNNTLDTPPQGNLCTATAGTGNAILIQGTVLAGDDVYENGTVLIDTTDPNGIITCAGCDCGSNALAQNATVVSCPDGVISPGLINTHQHLEFNMSEPQVWDPIRFEHRQDWRGGHRGHPQIRRAPGTDRSYEGIIFMELREVLAGTTSGVGVGGSVDSANGFMRNLDHDQWNGGLGNHRVDRETFPLDDLSDFYAITGSCDYGPSVETSADVTSVPSYIYHVSEGVDDVANNEFLCTSGGAAGEDLLHQNSALIHAIALTGGDLQLTADEGASVVWSPRTNISLYGSTANVTALQTLGVNLALGTDWTATGSINLLREFKCADYLSRNHYNGAFTHKDLWEMATINAASVVALQDRLGLIAPGYIADLAIYDGSQRESYTAVVDADVTDVALVLRGGVPLVGEGALVNAIQGDLAGCEQIDLCGGTRAICVQREAGFGWDAMQAAVAANAGGGTPPYPVFFCGEPDLEPTCIPMRPDNDSAAGGWVGMSSATDMDGDNIDDDVDNCPTIFNPVEYLHGTTQADADGDGLGDACDNCLLSAGDDCTPADPNDRDNDGVVDTMDNCFGVSNPNQTDTDMDGAGDECDRCPIYPNPMDGPCLDSVYNIKQGITGDTNVRLENLVVTGVNAGEGFFVQVPLESADYDGADYSGLYVFTRFSMAADPVRGDCVNLNGSTTNFFDQWQLQLDAIEVIPCGANTVPAPIVSLPADIGTNGMNAEVYEGMLVSVQNVMVTALNPPAGGGDMDPTNSFVVDSALRVNDFFHLVSPFPAVNDSYQQLTGVLRFANQDSKLEPRDAGDFGPPGLLPFNPAQVLVPEGSSVMVEVRFSAPAEADSTVTLTSSDATSVTVPASVMILAGSDRASFQVSGVQQATGVTVTAAYDMVMEDLSVRVFTAGEPRSVVAIDPTSTSMTTNTTQDFTITLDLPAAGNTDVTLGYTAGISGPAMATVLDTETTATFTVTAGAMPGMDTLTATLDMTMVSSMITVNDLPMPGLIFSEYVEGSSNNKAVEIYNGTAADFDLSACEILRYNNGSATTSGNLTLTGTLGSGETLVYCHTQANVALDALCDVADQGPTNFNGDDALELVCNNVLVDSFGRVGEDPGDFWDAGGVSTQNQTLRRKCTVTAGDADSSDAFDPSVEWDQFAVDDFSDLGQFCP